MKKIQEGTVVVEAKIRQIEEKDIEEARLVILKCAERNFYIYEQLKHFLKKVLEYDNANNKAMYRNLNTILNKDNKILFDYNKKGIVLNLFDESGKWVYGIKLHKNKLYVSENGKKIIDVHIS